MREIKVGDWVEWIDPDNNPLWLGRMLRVKEVGERDHHGAMLFFETPEWWIGDDWGYDNGWYHFRVRLSEVEIAKEIIKSYE